jgi:hypothetical protein
MCNKGDNYEHVGVYIDDLAFAMKEPQKAVELLEKK